MTVDLQFILAAAGGALALSGVAYFVGRRVGRAAEERMLQTVRFKEDELRRARLELSAVLKAEKRVSQDLAAVAAPIPAAELPKLDPEVAARLEAMEAREDARQKELAALIASMDGRKVLDELREVMAPLAEQARVQSALSEMPTMYLHRGHLGHLLREVAARAGLSTMILSDEVGLPLAATSADASEALAAAASLLLTLADRLASTGQPAPVGVVTRDVEGHLTLHRIFSLDDERYVLTAVSKGTVLAPDSMDPVLPQLRQLLAQRSPEVDAVA
ncbi:MAG: hypothetical protein KC933_08930 [Myxococcales bacterium]|nr:hypothetical protein [Myxococcales bacterium]